MTARSKIFVALMLVLAVVGVENAAAGVPASGDPEGATGASPARAAIVQRFLDGFWVTVPAEEPAPAAVPAAPADIPALVQAPIAPPPAPTLQLCSMPAWRRWHLPRWSWCAAVAMLAVAAAFALVGVLGGIWRELRHPRRLRQLAAVKALRAWRKTPTPSFADLLHALREFYDLPVGSDAVAVAAVVGKSDADLAQAILAMDRQRFAPVYCPAGESAVSTSNGEGTAVVAGTVLPVGAFLARWLQYPPRSLPGRAGAVCTGMLAGAAVLFLAAVIVSAAGGTRLYDLTPAWHSALQHAAARDYPRALDAFLAIASASPSSPELSHNLAALAAVTGRDEEARAWRRHALIQEQLRGTIRLCGRDWRWPVAVPALLLATAFVCLCVAVMGWPGAWRRTLAWRAWLLLPLALFAISTVLLAGHWRQCRRLQRQAIVAVAQPLMVTPGGMAMAAPLTQLTAGDCVYLRYQRREWSFVVVNGSAGWLPRAGMLPFRL